MKLNNILLTKKSVFKLLIITLLILLVPFIAMQFSDEVNWTVGDFIVAGVLLIFFGYLYNVLSKTSNHKATNVTIGVVLIGAFLLIWLSLI
jgi:hypothetical protein